MTYRPTAFSLLIVAAGLAGTPAAADCTETETDRITCSGETTAPLLDGRDGLTVVVESGAEVTVDGGGAIRAEGTGTRFTNGGTVSATGDAVTLGEDAAVSNNGTVVNTGADGAGLRIGSGTINNDASIESTGRGGAGVAVGGGNGTLTVLNLGTIRGETGFLGGAGAEAIDNLGLIEGTGGVALDLGAGDDVLGVGDNSGIIGTVILGDGDDILDLFFVDPPGFTAPVDGGAGDDLVRLLDYDRDDVAVSGVVDDILSLNFQSQTLFTSIDLDVTGFERFAFQDGIVGLSDLIAPIPLPAGGWLLLGALGGLGLLRSRD